MPPPFDFASFVNADLDELTAIVSRAAAAVIAIEPAAAAARTKSDLSPVTAADEAAESVVIAGLQRAMPGLAVISEEALERFAAPSPGSTFALVDALDGTREFIAGRDEFTINLAIIADGTPAIGVIAAPRLGLVWRGIVGRGAERLELRPGSETVNAHGVVPIHVRSRPAGVSGRPSRVPGRTRRGRRPAGRRRPRRRPHRPRVRGTASRPGSAGRAGR